MKLQDHPTRFGLLLEHHQRGKCDLAKMTTVSQQQWMRVAIGQIKQLLASHMNIQTGSIFPIAILIDCCW